MREGRMTLLILSKIVGGRSRARACKCNNIEQPWATFVSFRYETRREIDVRTHVRSVGSRDTHTLTPRRDVIGRGLDRSWHARARRASKQSTVALAAQQHFLAVARRGKCVVVIVVVVSSASRRLRFVRVSSIIRAASSPGVASLSVSLSPRDLPYRVSVST